MLNKSIELGRAAGFSAVEAFREKKMVCTWEGGERRSFHETRGERLVVRCFRETGDPLGFALSRPGLAGIRESVHAAAAAGSLGNKKNIARSLPAEVQPVKLAVYDAGVLQEKKEYALNLGLRLDELAVRFPRVRLWGWQIGEIHKKVYIANTSGLNAKYRKTMFSLRLWLGNADNRIEICERSTFCYLLQPDRLLGRGIFLLNSLQGKKRRIRGVSSLVLSPAAMAVVLRDFSGEFTLASEPGFHNPGFAPMVNLIDAPLLDGRIGSVPFDDEGVQCRETGIVRSGVLHTKIADLKQAQIHKTGSTGNGFRNDRGVFPNVRFSNLFLKPSVLSLNKILADSQTGILITQVKLKNTGGTARLYSAFGYEYRNGELREPVHFYLTTGFLSFFLKIRALSREAGFNFLGFNIGSPYVLVEAEPDENGNFLV